MFIVLIVVAAKWCYQKPEINEANRAVVSCSGSNSSNSNRNSSSSRSSSNSSSKNNGSRTIQDYY